MNSDQSAAELKALQDDIYREKVLRARNMTTEQRLRKIFELSNHQFEALHVEAMHKLGTDDVEQGWKEVRRLIQIQDDVEDAGLFATEIPEKHETSRRGA